MSLFRDLKDADMLEEFLEAAEYHIMRHRESGVHRGDMATIAQLEKMQRINFGGMFDLSEKWEDAEAEAISAREEVEARIEIERERKQYVINRLNDEEFGEMEIDV